MSRIGLMAGSLVGMLLATASIGAVRAYGDEEVELRGRDGLYPHQQRALRQLEEQRASELLARDKPKRRQPKHRKQRPNRASRRGK